jgi:hypothetical protein
MLNHAIREELIARNVAELVEIPKARKKSKRRNSWTVEEARQFLVSARKDNDPLYPLWVLILVMAMWRGEVMGLLDDDSIIDEAAETLSLEWQLVKPPGYPLRHKQELKAGRSGRLGIYSDPRHVILYTSNGEARQEFSMMPVIVHSIPDSSRVSRTAVWATDSPRSTGPPGRAQLLLSVRRISRIAPASLTTTTWTEGTRLLALGASGES